MLNLLKFCFNWLWFGSDDEVRPEPGCYRRSSNGDRYYFDGDKWYDLRAGEALPEDDDE